MISLPCTHKPVESRDALGELVRQSLKHKSLEFVDGPAIFDDMKLWEVWTFNGDEFHTAQVTEVEKDGQFCITVYPSFMDFVVKLNHRYASNEAKLTSRVNLLYKLTAILVAASTVGLAIYLIIRNQGALKPEIVSSLVMGLIPAGAIYFLGQWGAKPTKQGN